MTSARAYASLTPADPTDALWQRYRVAGDVTARAELLDRYFGLVHFVAREVSARTPAVEFEELVSAGTIGLVRALEGYDMARGVAFSTYAVRRIRGAILDDLRSRDWRPRSVRTKRRKIAAAVAELESRLGRAPEPREVAAELAIDLETYWRWYGALDQGTMVSFDGAVVTAQRTELTLQDVLTDTNTPLPGQELSRAERLECLRDALGRLTEKERTVLSLSYYEALNLRQIAEMLHVTESRISQIRTQALRRLRDLMAEWEDER